MKTSIITYHRVYNYGAALQAYATVSYFKQLGDDAEIIDYIPQKVRNYGSLKQTLYESQMFYSNKVKCLISAIVKMPSYKKQRKVFDKYLDKMLPLSKPYYSIEELQEACPAADVYCTGSDQVWNNTYLKEFDYAYFLGFTQSKNKIALSASFGRKDFTVEELQKIRPYLQEYKAISVRETSGLDLLSAINVPLKTVVLDPTLLINKESWSKQFIEIADKNYILVYQLHSESNASQYAKELGKKLNKKVISIETKWYKKKKGAKYIPTVEEFLSLINCADLVITDSFHGTAFSLNFNKNFIVTPPQKTGERIQSILKLMSLEQRIARSMNDVERLSKENIDFTDVNAILENERDKAKDFMNEAVSIL